MPGTLIVGNVGKEISLILLNLTPIELKVKIVN